MEILFTPWRYEYVSSIDDREGCFFCQKCSEDRDRENLILYRGEHCFVVLNLFPYSSGHLMVAPFRHTPTIEDLDAEALTEMMLLVKSSMAALRGAFHPDGFNIGVNIERVAGAGVKDHVHMHVVPRWAGDSNFMPITAGTRVMPLSLDQVYDALAGRI